MKTDFKFSVLMSVYKKDNPQFFKQALTSISTSQTLCPSQIVIVCDGPIDIQINDIINEFVSSLDSIDFTIIRKNSNDGLASALNCGIKECKYDWIARMDSDDISLPDRFEKQANFIKNNPTISVVGGNIIEFIDNPDKLLLKREVGRTHNEICKMAKVRTPMNHVTVFYKKSEIEKIGYYSEDFGKLEDYKLWVDLICSNIKFANINETLVLVRVGSEFIKRRSNKREIQDWDNLQKYLISSSLINKRQAFINRIYIRLFIYLPGFIKKILYKTFLRK